ncbi:MAG: putative ferredoxin [Frankiales bacterium]|nr:putative ferredoxin [Frankiales bacterium]
MTTTDDGPRVVLDAAACQGIGMCEAASPDVFEVTAEGTVLVHTDEVTAERRRELEDAVSSCPSGALRLEG